MRSYDFWKAQLDTALKEQRKLEELHGRSPRVQLQKKRQPGKTCPHHDRWERHRRSLQKSTKRHKRQQQRLEMLKTTKIPYFEKRLAELRNTTAWERLLRIAKDEKRQRGGQRLRGVQRKP